MRARIAHHPWTSNHRTTVIEVGAMGAHGEVPHRARGRAGGPAPGVGYALLTGMMRSWFGGRPGAALAAGRRRRQRQLRRQLAGRPARGIKDALTRHHPRRAHHGRRRLLAARRAAGLDRRLPRPSSRAARCSARMRTEAPGAPSWSMTPELPSGRVHVTRDQRVERRRSRSGRSCSCTTCATSASARRRPATSCSLSFFVLACGAALITVIAARFAWRDWTDELRQALSGDAKGAFQPLVRDVRALVERLAQEREREARGGRGARSACARRCSQHLHGERIVDPRQPRALHPRAKTRRRHPRCIHPASGLVTALEPVMRACSGVVGRARQRHRRSRDRRRQRPRRGAARRGARTCCAASGSPRRKRTATTTASPTRACGRSATSPTRGPIFRAEDWEHYRRGQPAVRRRGVRGGRLATIPIVLVQDYHFALAPRDDPRAPAARDDHHVLAHPVAERRALRHLPVARGAARGPARLAASSASTPSCTATTSSTRSTRSWRRASIARRHAVVQRRRAARWCARTRSRSSGRSAGSTTPPPVAECRAERARASSACAPDALLGVGVDRLDYTKGIEERLLRGRARCSSATPSLRGRFTFVQLAAPSRTEIERYRELNERVEALADADQRSASAPAATGPSSCCARTTSRRRSSATTAPPTSAT